MKNSDQEKEDQRMNSSMEDSNAMTIEFLRARLLSERSVSRSARLRADELARRVAELEEQLKIVSLQRKKAEKATVDVLAILESNGISDISEGFDSSSDQETPCESKVGNNSNKEENSFDSKLRRNESEELSGSDCDFSPVSQRALSWKGRKDLKHCSEKYKDSYLRRSSFASIGSSSSKHRVGKSCRQITRRESKSVVEECKMDPVKVDSQGNGVATSLEVDNRPEILRGGSKAREELYLGQYSDSGYLENGKNVTNRDVDFVGHGGDKDMEKALEDQVQLIGRYEEMEKAQREWEERFRENNSSTPDSCDPGNQSDVTEEREEIKTPVQCHDATVNSEVHEAKSEVYVSKELSKTQSNGFLPPSQGDMQCLGDRKCSSTPASEPVAQDFAFPKSNEEQNQESLDNNHYLPSNSFHHHLHPHSSPGKQSSQVVSSNTGNTYGGEVSGSHNELYALVPHETSNGFGGVLEALKHARLSLRQKISSLPLVESGSVGKAIEPSPLATKLWESGPVGKAIDPYLPATKLLDRVEIPVGCSGLFRVPTDYAVEATKANFLVSGSRPSSENYNSITGVGVIAGDQIVSSSYMDTRSTFSADNFLAAGDQFLTRPSVDMRSSYSTDNRFLTSQHAEIRSRRTSLNPTFDGDLNASVPSSRQYTYPTFSSYPNLMPRVASNERLSTFLPSRSVEMHPNMDAGLPFSSQYAYPTSSSYPEPISPIPIKEGLSTFHPHRSVGMPPANHLPFYNDHTRPNMYR